MLLLVCPGVLLLCLRCALVFTPIMLCCHCAFARIPFFAVLTWQLTWQTSQT
jgi:hypothetical protein